MPPVSTPICAKEEPEFGEIIPEGFNTTVATIGSTKVFGPMESYINSNDLRAFGGLQNGDNAWNPVEGDSSTGEGWYCPECHDGPNPAWNPCCSNCPYQRR